MATGERVSTDATAALAAALPNVPTIKYVIARGGRYNSAWWDRFATEVLAALDGWTLVPKEPDEVLTEPPDPSIWQGLPASRWATTDAEAEIARLRAALDGLVKVTGHYLVQEWTGSKTHDDHHAVTVALDIARAALAPEAPR